MGYISNVLTHWVGRNEESDDARYELLVDKILRPKELRFNKCQWDFNSMYGGIKKGGYGISMISFTDIPFSESINHCEKYSKFGVSFEKHYLVNCLASPVGYVQNPFIYQNYSYIFKRLHKLDESLNRVINQLDLNEQEREEYKKEHNVKDILGRMQYIMGFFQNYRTTYEDFDEREFNNGYSLDALCEALKKDGFQISSCDRKNLNSLLEDDSLFERITSKYPDRIPSPELIKLKKGFDDSREEEDKKENRKKLNRLALEEFYPNVTPTGEFRYNENKNDPKVGLEDFFEDISANYFEREWRMTVSNGAKDLSWLEKKDEYFFFRFNPRYLKWVIVPRSHYSRMQSKMEELFSESKESRPSVLTFEDLQYM